MTKEYYRVCHKDTLQGLWYDFSGDFTGLIHGEFNFCVNNQLKMDFDNELVGWLSATDSLDTLWNWFPKEDILILQEYGWFVFQFEAFETKFYERFQHWVIKQESSIPTKILKLNNDDTHDIILFDNLLVK
jgi:hypothetical protein